MVMEMPIMGVHCENCCRKVQTALSALVGVRHVNVQLLPGSAAQLGRVRVIGDAERASIEEAIRDAGFSVPSQ